MNNTLTILVVEDTPADQYIARRRLQQRWPDVNVVIASDGQEAIDWLEQAKGMPDLILLDIHMPGMGGHQFLQSWFSQRCMEIPVVVMLTSSAQEDDRNRSARYSNVKGFILKPLNPSDLSGLPELMLGEGKLAGERAA